MLTILFDQIFFFAAFGLKKRSLTKLGAFFNIFFVNIKSSYIYSF